MTKKVREFCNNCQNKTNHDVLYSKTLTDPDNGKYSETWWNDTFTLLECCGCESIILKNDFIFSEWNPGEVQTTFYPPRKLRRIPSWINDLPEIYESLLNEIYIALQSECNQLATMGIRSILDFLMIDKIGDKGGFKAKINEMLNQSFITKEQHEIFDVIIEAGNASVHRAFVPKKKNLLKIIEIIENMLYSFFISPLHIESIKKSTPPRKKKD